MIPETRHTSKLRVYRLRLCSFARNRTAHSSGGVAVALSLALPCLSCTLPPSPPPLPLCSLSVEEWRVFKLRLFFPLLVASPLSIQKHTHRGIECATTRDMLLRLHLDQFRYYTQNVSLTIDVTFAVLKIYTKIDQFYVERQLKIEMTTKLVIM